MRRHLTRSKTALIVITLTLALCQPVSAQQREPITGDRGSDMVVDLVLVRPLGIVATVLGTAGFIVALPFTVPSGSVEDTAREWIGAPLEYTFNRPLGNFDTCGADRHPCGSR